jgi:pimeloyl-ACP methyl ester carboxylesterase
MAPDLPGYGASSDVSGGAGSGLRTTARAIAELMVAAGEPVHLIGHSYGAAVALRIAQVWPELVRTLTLIEPAAFHFLAEGTPADQALLAEMRAVAGIMSACASDNAPDAAMAHFIDYWNGAGTWDRLAADQRARFVPQLGAVLSNFAASFADRARLADCTAVTCPVQFVMGLQSKGPAQRVTEMIADAIPQARLDLIADAGHMSPITHASAVNAIIAAHLAETEVRSASAAKSRSRSMLRWVA